MRELLQQLKGARLSAYMSLALNETEICLGRGGPLSVHAIAAQTGLSSRNVLRAVQQLAEKDFVTEVSERGSNREKFYRVSRHVPSGAATTTAAKRKSKVDPDKMSASKIVNDPVSRAKTKIDRDKMSGSAIATAPASKRESKVDHDTQPRVSASKIAIAPISRAKSRIGPDTRACVSGPSRHLTRTRAGARVVVVNNNTRSFPDYELKQQQQQQFTASREIFAAVHVEGKPLTRLARTVDANLAREWTDRLEDAPESFTDPVGFMIKHLTRNPTEQPPWAWKKKTAAPLIDDEFAKYVHGRPEHVQYCREHPEEVDCDCGKEYTEVT